MRATAGDFRRSFRVLTTLAAILFVVRHGALAGWMSAFLRLSLSHKNLSGLIAQSSCQARRDLNSRQGTEYEADSSRVFVRIMVGHRVTMVKPDDIWSWLPSVGRGPCARCSKIPTIGSRRDWFSTCRIRCLRCQKLKVNRKLSPRPSGKRMLTQSVRSDLCLWIPVFLPLSLRMQEAQLGRKN